MAVVFGASATRPLAVLEVDDEAGAVRLSLPPSVLRWLMPDWRAPLESVTAEAFGRLFFTRGVLLRAPDRAPAIFWCGSATRARALTALRRHS